MDAPFNRLARLNFRSRFKLDAKDCRMIAEKSLETMRKHAVDFVRIRLSPDDIENDGMQTPMWGHPVFKAQYVTACCCRGCLKKWHGIEQGTELTEAQQKYIVDVLMAWIEKNMMTP